MVKAHCSVCGKDFDMDDKYAGFVEKYPDRVKCTDCYKTGGADVKKATAKASGSSKAAASSTKQAITADVLRKSYDEVKAAFADVIDEVHDFIGGWTTTVALSKSK